MIDICTVVFEPELPVLRLQARSIELHCQNLQPRNIFVMVNDQDTCRVDPAWYGSMADRVQVVYRSQFGNQWSDNGWVSQQALKMLGSALSNNNWCMIVDAKTIFVRELAITDILVNGRVAVGSMPIYPVFEASRDITNQLFDIDLPAQLGPGGVPFFVEPHMVRSMIAYIESRTGQTFADYFQQQGRLTEFILYSGWVWHCDQTFDQRYDPHSRIVPVNLCHSEVAQADRKLTAMQAPDVVTVSIHRHAWSQLTDQQQQQYNDLLINRGIQ